jgi:ankyrin repeat protein
LWLTHDDESFQLGLSEEPKEGIGLEATPIAEAAFELDLDGGELRAETDELFTEDAVRRLVIELLGKAVTDYGLSHLRFAVGDDFTSGSHATDEAFLHSAYGQMILGGDAEAVQTGLGDAELDVHCATRLLDIACAAGAAEQIDFWVGKGADVNAPVFERQQTVFTRAVRRLAEPQWQRPTRRALAGAGAKGYGASPKGDPAAAIATLDPEGGRGDTPHIEIIDRLGNAGAAVRDDPRLLADAAGGLQVELTEWLLERGASVGDDQKRSALNCCFTTGDHDERVTAIVRLLLDAGADPSHRDPKYWDRTPIMNVAMYGPASAAAPLLAHPLVELDLVDEDGHSAVDLALERRRLEVFEQLRAAGARVSPAQDLLGLLYAATQAEEYARVVTQAQAIKEQLADHDLAHAMLLLAYIRTGDYESAVAHGEWALERSEKLDETILSHVSTALARSGASTDAAHDFWSRIREQLDPEEYNCTVIANLLYVYAGNGDFERAAADLLPWVEARAPTEKDDGYGLLLCNAACVYARLGERDAALRMVALAKKASWPSERIEVEEDLRVLHDDERFEKLLAGAAPTELDIPQRHVLPAMATSELERQRLRWRKAAEEDARKNEEAANLIRQLDALWATPQEVVDAFAADLEECFVLWVDEARAPDYDEPLQGVLLRWPGSETSPFGTEAAPYGFSRCLPPGHLHRGDPRFGGEMIDYVGGFNVAPVVGAFGNALEEDQIEDCDATEELFCFTLASLLGRAMEKARQSEAFAALSLGEWVYFFVQQHDQHPQLFYVHRKPARPPPT